MMTTGFSPSRRKFCTGTRLTLYSLSFLLFPLVHSVHTALKVEQILEHGTRERHRKEHKETPKTWNRCAAVECNSFEYNSDGSGSGLHFFKFPMKNPAKAHWCNLIKHQDRRDGFCVSENTVICEKHFRKHEVIKGVWVVRWRLSKGMVLIRILLFFFDSLIS